MNEFVSRIEDLYKTLAADKGPLVLSALFKREEAGGLWDLVLSPSRIRPEDDLLAYVAARVKAVLDTDDLLRISRIIVLRPDEPFVENVHRQVGRIRRRTEFTNSTFGDVDVERAYIFHSEPPVGGYRKDAASSRRRRAAAHTTG